MPIIDTRRVRVRMQWLIGVTFALVAILASDWTTMWVCMFVAVMHILRLHQTWPHSGDSVQRATNAIIQTLFMYGVVDFLIVSALLSGKVGTGFNPIFVGFVVTYWAVCAIQLALHEDFHNLREAVLEQDPIRVRDDNDAEILLRVKIPVVETSPEIDITDVKTAIDASLPAPVPISRTEFERVWLAYIPESLFAFVMHLIGSTLISDSCTWPIQSALLIGLIAELVLIANAARRCHITKVYLPHISISLQLLCAMQILVISIGIVPILIKTLHRYDFFTTARCITALIAFRLSIPVASIDSYTQRRIRVGVNPSL